MKEPTLSDIYMAVGEIKGEVRGIHLEMKRINGTLQNHDQRINTNESAIDQQKGRSALIGGIVGGVVSAIGLLLAWFGLKK